MKKDWNFDEVIDRSNTASMKWEPEVLNRVFGKGREDLLPLWVADMDFMCPKPVRKAMENRISHQIYGYSLTDPSYYSAVISWYKRRHKWLDDLLIYLHDNFNFLKTRLEQGLSGVKVFDLEGTYLAWADFRELGYDNESQIKLLEETAKVGLDHGNWFGDNGTGFERFNIACPRTILEKAVESIIKALK